MSRSAWDKDVGAVMAYDDPKPMFPAMQGTAELKRDIWNEAIEAAALIVQPVPHVDEERRCEDIAAQIRRLKK